MYRIIIENDMKSAKANASLYNWQPFDTGPMCHSVGNTSSTPSIQKDRASVENAHKHSKQWFYLRVSYGRLLKAKDFINAHNIQCQIGNEIIVANGGFEALPAEWLAQQVNKE